MEVFEGVEYYLYDGIPTVVDRKADIFINDSLYTTIYSTSNNLEEAVIGLLLSDEIISDISEIKEISIDETSIKIYLYRDVSLKRVYYDGCVSISELGADVSDNNTRVNWNDVMKIYKDFIKRTAAVKVGLAIHTSGIYELRSYRSIIVHDASRHVSILKLIGLSTKNNIDYSNSLIITTGRVSSDMIYRVAKMGIPIVISLHGPLSSGLLAALNSGVTLIANIKRGVPRRGLNILTHEARIIKS